MKVKEVGYECKTCHKFIREVSIPSLIGYFKAIQCGCGSWKIEEDDEVYPDEM